MLTFVGVSPIPARGSETAATSQMLRKEVSGGSSRDPSRGAARRLGPRTRASSTGNRRWMFFMKTEMSA